MKYGILITVILAFVLGWYFTQEPPLEKAADQTEANTPEKTHQTQLKNTPAPIASSTAPVDTPTIKQAKLPEVDAEYWPVDQAFHQDPMIDAFMGMIEYSLCNKFISPNENDRIKVSDLSEQQKDHLIPHFKQCEEQEEQVKSYSTNNLLSKLSGPENLKRMKELSFGTEPYTPEQVAKIYSEIKQKTGMELLVNTVMYKRFFGQEITPKVKVQLQAHDQEMIEYVIKQANFLLACERGADCSANSPVMNNICLEYEQGCNLDFVTYVNTHYTPGIRNEIQTTKNLLKTLFNFN